MLSIVIPTLNEEKNIEITLSKIEKISKLIELEVIIVDDNSQDSTLKKIQAYMSKISINIINNKINLGLGYALTRGYDSSKYPFVIFLDADLSISKEDILKLYKSRKDNSIIIGSRYIFGSKIKGANKLKVLVSYCLNYIIGKIFNLKIIDISHSFRIISKKIEIKTKNYTHPGFFWEMTVNAKRKNKTIKEIPITFIERKYGISKNKSLLMLGSVIKSFFNILK
tara:strand:- start:1520 stop:2194 length:675 start_codon:yes stop_codon:yes gene_type:complete